MKQSIRKTLDHLLHDQSGGEVLEYALIAGLIIIACIGAISLLGAKVKFGWQYIGSQL